MKTSEFLKRAWKHIDEPHKWSKGTLRRDTENGACFCSMGAIYQEIDEQGLDAKNGYIMEVKCALYLSECTPNNREIIIYNDLPTTTHDDIRKVWHASITCAEAYGN